MKHEKQAKSFIRKMIRKVKIDPYVSIRVDCGIDGETLYHGTKESDLLDTIFGVDCSEVFFVDLTTSRELGGIAIVLDYDRSPDEIVSDYIDNDYTNRLIQHAEKGLK